MGKYTRIVTEVPGPRSRELARFREEAVPNSAATLHGIFVAEAEGALLRDVDGNQFIDFTSGIGVLNVGHRHPRVLKAVREQLDKFTHTCFHVVAYEPYVSLAEEVSRRVPGNFEKKTFFANSGAEAIENAAKIARAYTRRPALVAFEHAFHGRTYLALSLTGKVVPYKAGLGPFVPEIYHVPFPYCYRWPESDSESSCVEKAWRRFEGFFQLHVAPEDVAAIFFEPVLGEGGFVPMPAEFAKRLRAFCDEHGILLVADEIQSGWGRTGKWFATEHLDITADITVSAKSLGGGFPLSAVTGRADVMDSPRVGGIGGTYGGNAVSVAAALAAIEVIDSEGLVERAEELGRLIRGRFAKIAERFHFVGDVRGLGAMNALELVRDRETKEPAPELVRSVLNCAAQRGLLLLKAGTYGNVIRTLPALSIPEDVLDEGLALLESAFEEVLQKVS